MTTQRITDGLDVGCHVKLSTVLDEEVEGEIFALDTNTNCLVLVQPGSTPFHNTLRLLKLNFLKAVVSSEPPSNPPSTQLPYVDMQRCRDREEKAIRAAEMEANKIGVGVTRQAQQIFDALCKTLPCRWDGQRIVVLDEIDISPPYSPQDCRSRHPEDTTAMARVKKVLTAERQRLGH